MSYIYRFITSKYNWVFENRQITNDTDADTFAKYLEDKLDADVVYTKVEQEDRKVELTPIDESKCQDNKTTEGKKYDSNKSMVGTLCNVFPNALLSIGNCIEFGTHKYPDPANWQKVDGAFTRYQDSIMRHYLKFLAGEERDKETGLLHLSHMAWNTLAVLELYLREHIDNYKEELYK